MQKNYIFQKKLVIIDITLSSFNFFIQDLFLYDGWQVFISYIHCEFDFDHLSISITLIYLFFCQIDVITLSFSVKSVREYTKFFAFRCEIKKIKLRSINVYIRITPLAIFYVKHIN